jgi:hypothetical protein
MLWIGLAACHYENLTADTQYHQFIKDLADRLSSFQQSDGRFLGGYAGSNTYTWASTEHNMDARAFYFMAYKLTGNSQYLTISNNAKNWLFNTAYNSSQKRFNRGHTGTAIDTLFATDTHSWGLLALSDVLPSGMIQTLFEYPELNSKTDYGFDFTNTLVSRSTIACANAPTAAISYEWTLQMAAAYKWFGYVSSATAILNPIASTMTFNQGIPYADRYILTFPCGNGEWTATTNNSMASLIWNVFARASFNPFSLDNVSSSQTAGAPTDVSNAKVYPNPLRMSQGKTVMTFSNLSPYANIRIYTYMGELVRQLSANVSGIAQWDAKNVDSAVLASGVYVAVIEGANGSRKVLKPIIEK